MLRGSTVRADFRTHRQANSFHLGSRITHSSRLATAASKGGLSRAALSHPWPTHPCAKPVNQQTPQGGGEPTRLGAKPARSLQPLQEPPPAWHSPASNPPLQRRLSAAPRAWQANFSRGPPAFTPKNHIIPECRPGRLCSDFRGPLTILTGKTRYFLLNAVPIGCAQISEGRVSKCAQIFEAPYQHFSENTHFL